MEDSEPEDPGNATIYVSGLKESTTKDAVTLFFENKRRTGGGDLCEEKGYKRISATVARLTYVSSKGNWINCIIYVKLFYIHLTSIISSFFPLLFCLTSVN